MPILAKQDDTIIRLVRQEAEKWKAKVNRIDLENQILDIECPGENEAECAVAIHKILAKHQGPDD
ncbi:MAG: hypothetical protein SWQ30_14145 [Thermodesulfobacteriota bacterium]|nr:hypothetical protein [Thermodesulfobacteriota bacterium]